MSQSINPTQSRLGHVVQTILEQIQIVATSIAPPVMRIALALPFFRSGLTRWDGFLSISPATLYLFENQFKLHILGAAYAFPAPDTIALLTATAEITLPILLVLGFATRFVALALLLMTGVIELVFPDGWANFHLYWAALALGIMALGAGPLSLDRLIARGFYRRNP
ncbi:DoxX family protein [Paraburkholderia sp. J12]|uniref:DoxX family protein n=1 Tax=Paraburkholderia sp. J12 TaxID=2805432 RepID=UPI002ABD1D1D|nr:DoxX family protein [Paraburkholderia sp. J12]